VAPLKRLWRRLARAVQIVLHYLAGLLEFYFPVPSGPQLLYLVFSPTTSLTLKGEKIMTVILKQGATVTLRAVDAAGLDVAPNTPAIWSVTEGFVVVASADTLSANLAPADEAVSASGVLTVSTPDQLFVTADVVYTAATVSTPAKLTLTFADNAAPAA